MTTEIIINGSTLEIEKRETIAITKSFFSVFNLAVRTSSYSSVFRVPKTQNNRLVFKSAGVVNSTNPEPYDKLTCIVRVDGVEIATGTAELLSSDGDYFRISVKADNSDFFTEIKALKLTDIESYLTSLNHDYNATDVSARRDLSTGVVYPNVDYGYMERASSGDQPYNYFFPALYLSTVIDSAIDLLGYKKKGAFWDGSIYNALAIMAKDIVPEGVVYEVEYDVDTGFNLFVSRSTSTSLQEFTNTTPLNYTEEVTDPDSLYVDTDLGTAWATFAYNFPANFSADDQFLLLFSGTLRFENRLAADLSSEFVENATAYIKLNVYNKSTNAYLETVYERQTVFFSCSYENPGSGNQPINSTIFLNEEVDLAVQSAYLTFDASVPGSATNFCLLWEVEIVMNTLSGETVSTFDVFPYIALESNFSLEQQKVAEFDVSIINSFDDINIGQSFLYLCNVAGVIPKVDERTKLIEMISFDEIRKNKSNALDWSNKIDLSEEPEITFKLDGYAKNNVFRYNNDDKDAFLKDRTNYGQGVLVVDNENLKDEEVKYTAPYSLVDIGTVFIDSSPPRTMARIFTGEKWIFDGVNYNLDLSAKIDGFTTRIVYLSRTESDLIQITSGSTVTGNYEVVNQPILFQRVINGEYSFINNMLSTAKVVKALFRLNITDIGLFDFSKPVYIDYFNDYFYVNEISQFKVNEVDSTFVTLIRM